MTSLFSHLLFIIVCFDVNKLLLLLLYYYYRWTHRQTNTQ